MVGSYSYLESCKHCSSNRLPWQLLLHFKYLPHSCSSLPCSISLHMQLYPITKLCPMWSFCCWFHSFTCGKLWVLLHSSTQLGTNFAQGHSLYYKLCPGSISVCPPFGDLTAADWVILPSSQVYYSILIGTERLWIHHGALSSDINALIAAPYI